MRKTCEECGLICFPSEVVCKRCGSGKLLAPQNFNKPLLETDFRQNSISGWGYLISFVIALIIEFFAFLWVVGMVGTGHGNRGAGSGSFNELLAFLLHLPTVLFPWFLTQMSDIFAVLYLVVPFTQIIFWTIFLPFARRKIRDFFQ